MKFTIDYYKSKEVIGGVQSFFDLYKKIYPDFKTLSYVDAIYPILCGVTKPSNFHMFEIETSGIIQDYINKYEKIFDLDVIVKNSIVGTLEKHKTPMISVIQDNNLLGPYKLYRHGFYNYYSYNVYARIFPFLQKSTIMNSDVVVSTSEHVKDCYDKKFGIDSEIIPNGIDTNIFKPLPNKDKLKEKYGIPKDKKVAISVTGFLQIKGWHILQKLINEYQDIFWIIVLKHKSERPRLKNVKILNQIPKEQLVELYNCSDFFVLPSAMETCNLAGLEAIASGLPIIVTNAGYFWNKNLENGFEYMDVGIRVENWNHETYKNALDDFLERDEKLNIKNFISKNKIDMESWKTSWKGIINKLI